jgi:membrane protease YdiL (CAAX protease family)
MFFRGYMQGRLEEAWPPTRKLFGAPLGKAWLVSSLLFGLGHFLVTFEPQMMTRAVPGLAFGWMFARTRSVFASALFHATCNLLMETLVLSFLT